MSYNFTSIDISSFAHMWRATSSDLSCCPANFADICTYTKMQIYTITNMHNYTRNYTFAISSTDLSSLSVGDLVTQEYTRTVHHRDEQLLEFHEFPRHFIEHQDLLQFSEIQFPEI